MAGVIVSPAGRAAPDSTADRVAAEILRRLMNGEVVPGQRLIEAELATEFAVSRGPVREALSRLAAEGHLVLERNRGAVVRRMTLDDVRELYQLREILEGAAAGLAARHVEVGDARVRLEAALATNSLLVQAEDLRAYVDHNEVFHALVVDMARSALLAETVAGLRTRAFRVQFRHLLTGRGAQASAAQHAAVGAVILAGDADAAERLMREHVRLSGQDVLAGYGASGP